MAPEAFVLDPELEQLLIEVAADPDSCLLRVPRPKALPALFESDTRVSDRMAGLGLAERELLRVHRRELAELLLEVCRYKLIEGPRSRHFIYGYGTDGMIVHPANPAECLARVETHYGEQNTEPWLHVVQLVRACAAASPQSPPSVASVAAAASRLAPSLESKGLAAQFYAQGDGPRKALRALGEILDQSCRRGVRATAWSTIGCAYSRLLIYSKAHDAYVHSSALEAEYLPAWVGRMLLACQSGRAMDARISARVVDAICVSNEPIVSGLTRAVQSGRLKGDWAPSSCAAETAAALGDHFASATRELIDVLR